MKGRNKGFKKTELTEKVIQKFSYRCPYCDQPVSYDEFDLTVGENEIQCLSCKKVYIKMVGDSEGNDLTQKLPSLGGKG